MNVMQGMYSYVVYYMYEDSESCEVLGTVRMNDGCVQDRGGLALKMPAVGMDRVINDTREESPWTLLFAVDIVTSGESRELEEGGVHE